MRLKLAQGLAIRQSRINGKGCFATARFQREAKRRAHRAKLRICEVDAKWSIDGSRGGNGTHYINHSCEPNSYMKIIYGHILFYALRDIRPGEEITIDYVETLHSDEKRCSCGASTCRGRINKQ
jgi:hypothetical protein